MDWLTFIARLEALYANRSQEDMLRAAKERVKSQEMESTFRFGKQHLELTRGVDRSLKEYTDGSGKAYTAAAWSADPFSTPTPFASTLRTINGEEGKKDGGNTGGNAGAGGNAGGRGRQRNRGGNKGGQKRDRSPTPEAAAAASSQPHDGRRDEANREHQRQLSNKRQRDNKGHFVAAVKPEGDPASGSNSTPLGSRPGFRKGYDSAGKEVNIRGPCNSCGLNHQWRDCRRNPNARSYNADKAQEQGPHFIAKLPGYKLGDENGAYRSNPAFIASSQRDRVAGAGSQ